MRISKNPWGTIPSAGASITDAEVALVHEAAEKGWYQNRNRHTEQFIDAFRQYTGSKYCLPVSSCTAAIHLALLGLKIGKGDEVIIPDITWVASAAPIHYVGAKIIFADIDSKTWCLSPTSFEQRITPKTKAVIAVDLYGNVPEMDEIRKIARKHRIAVIEDAAEGLGATYKGRKAGTLGDVNVFSFNATKLVMAGQGGMLTTDNEKVYLRAKQLAHHGMIKYTDKTTFWSVEIGYNYQWTNIQAALALAQFRRLNELVNQRRQIFTWYQECLSDVQGLQLNEQYEHVQNTYWVVTGVLNKKWGFKKEELMSALGKHGIDTRPFFYPVSSMPAYKQYVQGKKMAQLNPVAYMTSRFGISFPSAANLSRQQVNYVCDVFKKIMNRMKV